MTNCSMISYFTDDAAIHAYDPLENLTNCLQDGGGVFTSGTLNTSQGDSSDEMLVVIAHVVIGAKELVPLGE